jgi:4-amino-4-deoxy-L-arabinose transferase-like glycosyltransferase
MSVFERIPQISKITFQRVLLLIILGYLLLAIIYSLSTPPLEASDEYKHFPVVQHIQTNYELPILDPEDPGLWLQEAAQPPLYYILMAAITLPLDTGDLADIHQVNPHAYVGNPNQIHNKNLIIHQPDLEAFPWNGSVLAIYLIRLLSILMGVGTILITSRLALMFFDPSVALLAAAMTAFNPMFIFVSASVNNDSLAILLGTLISYLLVNFLREPPESKTGWWRYLSMGLIVGLGALTKLSIGGLLLFALGITLLLAWRRRDRSYLFGSLLVLIGSLLLITPWALRNLQIYDDPTALSAFIEVQGTREVPITLHGWQAEFGTFYRSFWGLFGGVNIAAPEFYYYMYNLMALIGLVGLLLWFWKQRKKTHSPKISISPESDSDPAESDHAEIFQEANERPRYAGLWLLFAWPILLIILVIRWNAISPAFQGRLIFPAIASINILLAIGLLSLFIPRSRPKVAYGLSIFLFAAAAILPWLTIRPAYALPDPLGNVPVEVRYGPISFTSDDEKIDLVGVELAPGQSTAQGDEAVKVTLYWTAASPLTKDYLSSIHLLGRENESIGMVNRYPAWGMVPTSRWQQGQIWRDEYHIYPGKNAISPSRLNIRVSMYDTTTGRDLEASGLDGAPIELLLVGEARLGPNGSFAKDPSNELVAEFSDGITLVGYDYHPDPIKLGEPLNLALYWVSEFTPSTDYTVFIHLIDDAGNQLAVADGPPLGGYYPTYIWQPGEQLVDEHMLEVPLDLPDGDYIISIGLYDPISQIRVPLINGPGDALNIPIVLQTVP